MDYLELINKIFNLCDEFNEENTLIEDIKRKCDLEIFRNKIINEYNINISPEKVDNKKYIRISSWHGDISIGEFNEENVRNMEKKPHDEILLAIQFPTGPYIFGENYDTELFFEFYKELKSYNPKFCDDINHYLYYDMNNASKIFNDYEKIYKKYKDIYNSKIYKRKIEELKREIEFYIKEDKKINGN